MQIINTIGRRKTSVARVYMNVGAGVITINGREFKEYFPIESLQNEVTRPLVVSETLTQFDFNINVDGGGITGQAGAIKLGIARALNEYNAEFRVALKAEGLFTRDPRMVERKKFGRAKARKRFQFSKR